MNLKPKLIKLADLMVDQSLEIKSGDRLLLNFNPTGSELAKLIGKKAAKLGAAVIARCSDKAVEAAILEGVEQNQTAEIFNEMVSGDFFDVSWSTKVLYIRCNEDTKIMDNINPKIISEYHKALYPTQKLRVERRQWSLVYLPTKAEAKKDGMSYKNYVNLFFRACDRPWDKIKKAQQHLIDKYLDKGKELEIWAGKTHLKMSIKNQLFENSLIDCNVPGSEVFSSPVRGTIEGQLILPYSVNFAGRCLPNLELYFENGKVVKHKTSDKKGQKFVEEQLNLDEGAREVGEVAFGTNSVFNRPFLNGLFVEKVGGSGHIAIGCAYQGKVDNGVRSANHIDLTFMMLPKYGGGKVVVDGKIIQKDGKFLDKKLTVLNSVK